jgi:MerC mercury resistance protein
MPAEPFSVAPRLLPRVSLLDRLGVVSSTLCAIHCLLTPLALAALPVIGVQAVLGESLERSFVAAGLALGSLSLTPSFRRLHRRLFPLMLFLAGALLWLIARLGLASDSAMELPTMIAGSAAVVTAHVVNRRLCRACRGCAEESR